MLRTLFLAVDFRSFLRWERSAVKDYVGLYLVVAQKPNTMHCVVDIPR